MTAPGGVLTRWYESERAIPILLGVFVVAWTAFHNIVYAPIGLHPDLTEVYDWGRHPLAGYYKHPPLSGLICTLWFAIFPAADWAFYLLAMVNAAAGLLITDLIARRYLPDNKRAMVLLLLLMTPFYQFIAQKFNANAILLSTWPLAVYCFLRAFESRTPAWSLAAGAACALAMLGKYYSIYLVGGVVLAALTHPKAAHYLKSPSPWISAVAGVVVLAPHIEWLMRTGFQPFAYAYDVHGGSSLVTIFLSIGEYLAGAAAYVALPVVIYLVIVRPTRRRLIDTLWPKDASRRMLVTMQLGFLMLPALSAPFLGVSLTSLWTMQIWFLLPIILLAPNTAKVTRMVTLRSAGALLVFTAVAIVVAAPLLAWRNFARAELDDRGYTRPLSDVVTSTWHARVGRRLTLMLGEGKLAASVSFYSHDHPDSVPDFVLRVAPWVTPMRLINEGWAAACRADDAGCLAAAAAASAGEPRVRRSEVEIVPRFLGFEGKPARFVIVIMPPSSLARSSAWLPLP